ncbi:3-dehydroquinate synthase, partial [Pseudomonas sp. ATCC 13867]
AKAKLPVVPPQEMNAEHFLEHMAVDKKVLMDVCVWSCSKGWGAAVVTAEFPREILEETLRTDYQALVGQAG